MPGLLDTAVLDRFENALRDVGAAVVEHLAPGLDDASIDELLVPRDIDLPEEARAWWRWHNGTMPGTPPHATQLIPGREQTPLEGAVNLLPIARDRIEIFGMTELAKHVPIVSDKPMIYADCNGTREAPTPIYTQNDDPEPPELALPSMGELITIWTQLLDLGAFATTPDGQWKPLDQTASRSSFEVAASSDPVGARRWDVPADGARRSRPACGPILAPRARPKQQPGRKRMRGRTVGGSVTRGEPVIQSRRGIGGHHAHHRLRSRRAGGSVGFGRCKPHPHPNSKRA